jgi:hypothetical protein
MITIENTLGFKAHQHVADLLSKNKENAKELKAIYNEATELPLIFLEQEMIMGYQKIHVKKKRFKTLFFDDDFFPVQNQDADWPDVHEKLAELSFFENHLYLGRTIMMAEEIKKAAQIMIKPVLDKLTQSQKDGGKNE